MVNVSLESVDQVVISSLLSVGVDDKSVPIILDTIHYANKRGVPTHGIGRLPLYVKKIKAGHLNPKDECRVIEDYGAISIIDAKGGFGQVAAKKAITIAIDKAKKYGVSAVGVRNSNNFGTAGFYGDFAAKNGMAAMIYANAAPAIAPTGGNKPIFGTNPMCYAFPGGKFENPIILDMATTVAARGKIRLAAKNGEKIPLTWATDKNGKATDSPEEALNGALLPIAGYKGYGLSTFVDLFAGVLTGSASTGNVKPLSDLENDSRNGHLFVVIDVRKFLDEETLDNKIKDFYGEVKKCGETGAVLLPGERGYAEMEKHTEYVTISDKQFEEINLMVKDLNIGTSLERFENE